MAASADRRVIAAGGNHHARVWHADRLDLPIWLEGHADPRAAGPDPVEAVASEELLESFRQCLSAEGRQLAEWRSDGIPCQKSRNAWGRRTRAACDWCGQSTGSSASWGWKSSFQTCRNKNAEILARLSAATLLRRAGRGSAPGSVTRILVPDRAPHACGRLLRAGDERASHKGAKTQTQHVHAAVGTSPDGACAGPGVLKCPSSLMSSKRTDMRFETPASSIVTPYRTSAPAIVRLWCVITMNCVHSWNSLIAPR